MIKNPLWNAVSIDSGGFFGLGLINFGGLHVVSAVNACMFFNNTQAVISGGLYFDCGESGTIVALDSNLVILDTRVEESKGPAIALSRGSAFVKDTTIIGATGVGILLHDVISADVRSVQVRNTKAYWTGSYGDGIDIVGGSANGPVWVTDSLINNNHRTGLGNFGAFVALEDTRLRCNGIDLEGESWMQKPASFSNLGGNGCGCPAATGSCVAVGVGFAPPAPANSIP
jgi:hypothetical protein